MKYSLEKNKIIFDENQYFNAKDILTCGQVFRYCVNSNGNYEVYSMDKKAEIINGKKVEIVTDDVDYFVNYFDLNTNYEKIIDEIQINDIMKQATEFGKGIRILNQDLFEMIISFIISANNNIKRIQLIINRLCVALGENKGDYFAFPTPEKLKSVDIKFFSDIGAGYRADYLYNTLKVLDNAFLNDLVPLDTINARKNLLKLKGVGNKVADCILLFGLSKHDVFPVDTWIEKVYHLYFEQNHKQKDISQYLVSLFKEKAGYAQQYLFYFQREL